jgi:hypothetical protein
MRTGRLNRKPPVKDSGHFSLLILHRARHFGLGCELKRRVESAPYPISPVSAIQQNSFASAAMHKKGATSLNLRSTVC